MWKPLLHEIAAGSMDVAHHELEYLAQGYWHGFQFRYGEMTGIDRKKQLVYLAATYDEEGRQITPVRSFRYDTLVIAIGSVGNDFGTPGVNEHAIMLDTPEEAERFNRRLINACVRAYAQPEPIRPGSCTWPSSAPAQRAPSLPPSCTRRRAASWPSASTRSIPRRTSRSR